jgi:hypothetical protein
MTSKPQTALTLIRRYERNEDINYHAENRILLAKHFGTAEEYKDALDLKKLHIKQGSLPVGTALYERVYEANTRQWPKLLEAARAEWAALPKAKAKNKPHYVKD